MILKLFSFLQPKEIQMTTQRTWSEQDERIIAWAQLQGLTGRDFVRIGQAMLRDERMHKAAMEILNRVQGYQWQKTAGGFELISPLGAKYVALTKSTSWAKSKLWQLQRWSAPAQCEAETSFRHDENWDTTPMKLYPDRNRHLYRIICEIADYEQLHTVWSVPNTGTKSRRGNRKSKQ